MPENLPPMEDIKKVERRPKNLVHATHRELKQPPLPISLPVPAARGAPSPTQGRHKPVISPTQKEAPALGGASGWGEARSAWRGLPGEGQFPNYLFLVNGVTFKRFQHIVGRELRT
jgi:hypothetical protein